MSERNTNQDMADSNMADSNIEKITQYILSGINTQKRIGLELEHFVYDADEQVMDYDRMSQCLVKMAEAAQGEMVTVEGRVLGYTASHYAVSLEPGCQLEISISPKEAIADIVGIYRDFRVLADRVFGQAGFALHEHAVLPTVESGEIKPDDITLLPKKRYACMDKYFEHTGEFGKYMMRATAATQISIDFSSEEDALLKLRVLQKLAPIVALLTENRSGIRKDDRWKPYLTRCQIWRSVDAERCGYLEGSLSDDYSIEAYAEYLYHAGGIVVEEGDQIVDIAGTRIDEYYAHKEIENVDYFLSMYFPNVRVKKYIEYRIPDSMKIEDAKGYMHFVKQIVYDENVLREMDRLFSKVTSVAEIYEAEDAIFLHGYDAHIYGAPVMKWLEDIFEILLSHPDESNEAISRMIPVVLLNKIYCDGIRGHEEEHAAENVKIREYLSASTAKYHDRVVRTLYVPKIFSDREIRYMRDAITELYGIFDKVIAHYMKSAEYRQLFGFEPELEELILHQPLYSMNIPMARIDLFLNEETRDFKFCEFNTDGASAMNEDRELNTAFRLSKAYKDFSAKYPCRSFELFDSWVEEALKVYREYAEEKDGMPNVCIVDFLENATINEFYIFKEAFEKKGCVVSICDIRNLRYEDGACYSEDDMRIDLIYRRAVTSDIMAHYDEVGPFIEAFKNNSFCLVGDFRTQIVHNKVLYKILHMKQTSEFLNKRQQLYIRNHIPYTVSLSDMFADAALTEQVFNDKDRWIIKPEDSYGSKGVYAGVELDEEAWRQMIQSKQGEKYILQEFCTPYRTDNIVFDNDVFSWIDTSNLTGLFVYNGQVAGIYSRISFEQMISTQYNEMALPTIVAG